jgi:UDP-glucose 4-epimerase
VNVTGTLSALEFAKAHNARLVFASSAAVYGMPDNVPISEDAPPEPCSPYGAEKLAAEHYVRLYNQLYDIETVGLRLFNVYGPGQPPNASAGVITRFMKDAIDDQPLTIHGDGEQTRDFVHVNDVVDACLAAGTTAYTGEMFNIGTGYETSVNELADKILDAADSTAGVVRDTPRSGDIARSCADIEKAQNKLGYAPTVEITDGLNSLVEVA